MSTFCGRMREYCNVSIDRFDGENLQSTAFFLSHCHQDHMNGLTSSTFSYHLGSSTEFHLYCSDITKILLETDSRYTHLVKHVEVLPVNEPTTIKVPDKTSCKEEILTVTLIPAGHCLGSVMFLFEGSEGNALYTGDFRLPHGGPSRLLPLLSGLGPKHLKSLYIDTTFCVLKARHIPSREESADAIVTLLEGWLYQSKQHVVKLITKAAYSYEHLFEVIYKKFGKKVHVSDQRHLQYQLIPGLQECTTNDPAESQIHACGWKYEKGAKTPLPCGYHPPNGEDLKLMVIQPSTMWFTQHVGMADIVKELASKYRVCYCFHPSYSEVQEFVQFFKPEKVFPNVKPLGISMKEVQSTIDMFLTSARGEAMGAGDNQRTPVKKSLGKLKTLKRKKMLCSPPESEGLLFGEEEFVPKKRRKPSVNNKPLDEAEPKMETPVKNHRDENSDADSYHTNSYKGSDDEHEDILASGDDAEQKMDSAETPPTGSLLSYMSDDEDLDNNLSKDLQNSQKSNGFSQSADMFDADLLASQTDCDDVIAVENGILVDECDVVPDGLNGVEKDNGAETIGKATQSAVDHPNESSNDVADSGSKDDDRSAEIKNNTNDDGLEQVSSSINEAGVTTITPVDNANSIEADGQKKCDPDSSGDVISGKKTGSVQNYFESSGEHGDVIVDTDATTICSQPCSQNVCSDGDVDILDKSVSSSTSGVTVSKRTARKSLKGSCHVTHVMQSGLQQARNPRNVHPGPQVIDFVDLTADDTDESDAKMVGEELSDSSVMEYGECSDEYEGDESFCGDEMDSEDDYSYFRQGHPQHVLDSDDDELVEYDEDDTVIIVGSSSEDSDDIDNIDLTGEARQIARVRPMQRERTLSEHLAGDVSSSDVDIIHERIDRDDDSDLMLEEEDVDESVVLHDDVVTLDDNVVNLDDSIVDLDNSVVDIDEDIINGEKSGMSSDNSEQNTKLTESLQLGEKGKVFVLDANLANLPQESQDLFSSDNCDHTPETDQEAAIEAALLDFDQDASKVVDEDKILDFSDHESVEEAVEAKDDILDSDHELAENAAAAKMLDLDHELSKDELDEDKLLGSDNEDNSGEICADDVLFADGVQEKSTGNTDDELLGPSDSANFDSNEMESQPVESLGSDQGLEVTKATGESSDLGVVADLDPLDGVDSDHLLFSDPEEGRAHSNDADLDPKLLD